MPDNKSKTVTIKIAVTSMYNALNAGNKEFDISGIIIDREMPPDIERAAGEYFGKFQYVRLVSIRGDRNE